MRSSPVRTERLVLRPIEPVEAPDLWEAIESSRWHLEQWLPWVPYNTTPEAVARFAEACAADWDAGRAVRFVIRDRRSRELHGVVGLDSCVHIHRACELGYFSFGYYDEKKQQEVLPDVNFVRFAVPRLRYEKQDLESVVWAMKALHEYRHDIPGVEVTYGRNLPLRHFKARFAFKK